MKQICKNLIQPTFLVLLISAAAIDSESELPTMITLICLLLMGLLTYVGELWIYDEDEE